MDYTSERFKPFTAGKPSAKVEISVSCRKVPGKDVFSKSDPMCVFYTADARTGHYTEVGRTEEIKDNLNPDFANKFVMDYFFEESQQLKFEIYDIDAPTPNLDKHDFLGSLEITLGEIVGSPGSSVERPLQCGPAKDNGTIILRVEELTSCNETVTMHFQATNLDKMHLFGKSDPFLVFSKANSDGSFTVAHRTEVIKNTLSPTWEPFTVPIRHFCNGDYDRQIRVECYDWNQVGSPALIGEFLTSMRALTTGQENHNQYEVINPNKKSKKNYRNSGMVSLISITIHPHHSFLDFIRNGMQMALTVAVDFTSSNGDPQHPGSLHYLSSSVLNQYATAITAVGHILQGYDSDKLYPAFGFGARMPDGVLSHDFPLNLCPSSPECQGVQGILDAYYYSLQRVQLFGPSHLSPIIKKVARLAEQEPEGSKYFVLLIITDGVVQDMQQTREAIVNAAALPVSIIIVGVGDADFGLLQELYGDAERVSYNGHKAERDNVQFLQMNRFVEGLYVPGRGSSKERHASLAKEVLAKIPHQVVQYMTQHSIGPGQTKASSQTTFSPTHAARTTSKGFVACCR